MEGLGLTGATRRVAEHARSIVRLEIQLATAELKAKLTALGTGLGFSLGAAVLAFLALSFALAAAAAGLATTLPVWASLLIVAGAVLLSARSARPSASRSCGRARTRFPSRRSRKSSAPRRRCAMGNEEAQIREEIAAERQELTDAVSSLRSELDHTAERGKWVGVALGAALAVRTALKVRRHFRD